MLMLTPLGSMPIGGLLKGRPRFRRGSRSIGWALVIFAVAAPVWWFVGAAPLLDAITRVGGVFRAPPHVLG